MTGADRARGPIELRRAEPRDVPHIMGIDVSAYPTPWSRRLVQREVTARNRIHLVAQHRFDIVGHGAVALLADTAHVTTIAVRPEARRRSVGHDLLLALTRGVLAAGGRGLTLEVRAGNEPALALYRRFGLRPAGVRRGYYGDTGEDALVLWAPEFDDEYRRRISEMSFGGEVVLSPELSSWEPVEAPSSRGVAQ